jgi:dienelactone hydrolase
MNLSIGGQAALAVAGAAGLLLQSACAAPTPSSSISSHAAQIAFPRLEGVYRQGDASYVVTYQGWWLDMQTQEIRQLNPLGGGDFDYGPGWQVTTPSMGRLHFGVDPSGAGATVTGTAPGGQAMNAVRMRTTARNVHVQSGGAVIAGTVTVPTGPGPHPGIVILQGSGALDRHFESISQGVYLSMGFAILAIDKRGTGESTGVFPGELATPDAIATQAADGAAAARFLMAQPEIDAQQVGFDGNSQGGWVAPLATEQVPGLKFDILIASPAVTSGQQGVYASFSGSSQYVPAESDATIDGAVRAASGGYDPTPALSALRIPAIWIFGELDRQVPVRVCLARLAAFKNPLWTVDVLPHGSHGTIETQHGLDSEVASATRFAGDYFAAVRAWVAQHITFP